MGHEPATARPSPRLVLSLVFVDADERPVYSCRQLVKEPNFDSGSPTAYLVGAVKLDFGTADDADARTRFQDERADVLLSKKRRDVGSHLFYTAVMNRLELRD